jgi:hypothetical protein
LVQAADPALAGRTGLGLGLYICKELVTRQGGLIWVTSRPGDGSVFSFTLPVFSLAALLAPTLGKESRLEGPITLISVELGAKIGWLSDAVRSDHAHEVRDLLQHCLQSDTDVLLPKMGASGSVEMFFIVASADDAGGKVLIKRILEQWQSYDYIDPAALTLAASQRLLEPFKRDAGESMEVFLENVAGSIHNLMNEEISSRVVASGQQENTYS